MSQQYFRDLVNSRSKPAKVNKNEQRRLDNLNALAGELSTLGQAKSLNLDEISKQKQKQLNHEDSLADSELDKVIASTQSPPTVAQPPKKRARDDILQELRRSKAAKASDAADDSRDSPSTYKVPSPQALDSDDDIFADSGSYDPPQLSDSESEADSNSEALDAEASTADADNILEVDSTEPQRPISPLRQSLSPSPSPELDDSGRLVGLSSSALPNVSQRIQTDKDAEIADQRKQRKLIWLAKQGIKKDTGEGSEPLPQKTQTDSQKLNSDYQRINAYIQKKGNR
ncbi:hypothetical protein E3P99_03221 [Wallemia hederae]|uniref:Uncharacterized protein n=1 Tax=Wallemia hederae TaxID=1540922 RepID=A0A4T0FII9_9BASI|nr:hypothetical protein E3P99_03221 [Wallemia hederae]